MEHEILDNNLQLQNASPLVKVVKLSRNPSTSEMTGLLVSM